MSSLILWGFVYMRREPASDLARLVTTLNKLRLETGLSPSTMRAVSPTGKRFPQKSFAVDRATETLALPDTGDLWLRGGIRGKEKVEIHLYVRYSNPNDLRWSTPAQHSIAVPLPLDPVERAQRVAALETFLVDASAPFAPLHGAIGVSPHPYDASGEIGMSASQGGRFARDGSEILDRRQNDQRFIHKFWTHMRRPYWLTLLGPDLARECGGIDAARATGAARVEMRGDSLVVQVTDDVGDSLGFDFWTRSQQVRRWLWPHTIQNPLDGTP